MMKLQDMTDQGSISPDSVPRWDLEFSTPNGGIQDFSGGYPKASEKSKTWKSGRSRQIKTPLAAGITRRDCSYVADHI